MKGGQYYGSWPGLDATSLGVRNQISKEQLASKAASMKAQTDVQQSLVDQARAFLRAHRSPARHFRT